MPNNPQLSGPVQAAIVGIIFGAFLLTIVVITFAIYRYYLNKNTRWTSRAERRAEIRRLNRKQELEHIERMARINADQIQNIQGIVASYQPSGEVARGRPSAGPN